MRVGLTGGVGSGKSTVARLLAGHGAVVIDADAIAREVVEPGTPGLAAVVEAFGDDVLAADGRLDRAKLAGIVFGDDQLRVQLNSIVHPLVGNRTVELAEAAPRGSGRLRHPAAGRGEHGWRLRQGGGRRGRHGVRIARLAERGMPAQDARERMAAQASDEQRRVVADVVIENNRSLDDLRSVVDDLWELLSNPRDAA